MIAKILKATTGFSGILYSELKIDAGKAAFCGAFNFPFAENNVQTDTYVNYLEQLAETNHKKHSIKNRQFHAVISTKGHDHDQAFLTDIAQKWMRKMGYGDQPYLVYFHGDTENNHVHIVSCRIDIQGNRIEPYMEGRRAGIAIRELMNENLAEKAKADLSDILNNYSFSTKAQFKLALERRGWKTREKDGKIHVVKFVKQGSVSVDDVMLKAERYEKNNNRIRQLRAIFNKYRGLPQSQFQNFMRENFGVEVIFHTAAGQTAPYGYTVIDHTHKLVMKGGEIMPLEALTKKLSTAEHTRLAQDIVNSVLSRDDNPLYSDLNKRLYRNGYQIKKNIVTVFGDDQPLIELPEDIYKKLRYNDRLHTANQFVVRNATEASALSRIFFVRASDIRIQPEAIRDDHAMRELISMFGSDREMIKAFLGNHQMELVSLMNNTYIINMRDKMIADVSGLGLERGIDLDKYPEQYAPAGEHVADVGLEALAGLFGIVGHISGGGSSGERDDDNERRRKRRRKRTI